MEAVHTLPTTTTDRSLKDEQPNERRCLVTGEVLPKTELIRFVVGPDAVLVPDLAQNLPGRGLWVRADHTTLQKAIDKKLFAKAAQTNVTLLPNLIDQTEGLLRKRCLDFLGLARRSGIAVLGQPQVEGAIKAGLLKLLLIASDASDKGVQDVLQMRNFGDMPVSRSLTRDELGMALGYDQVVYVGLKSHALTHKFQAEMARFDKLSRKDHFTEK